MQKPEPKLNDSAYSSESLCKRLPNIRPSQDLQHPRGSHNSQHNGVSPIKQPSDNQRKCSSSSSDESFAKALGKPPLPRGSASKTSMTRSKPPSGFDEDFQPTTAKRSPKTSKLQLASNPKQMIYTPEVAAMGFSKKMDTSVYSSSSSEQNPVTMIPFPKETEVTLSKGRQQSPRLLRNQPKASVASSSSSEILIDTVIPIGLPAAKFAVPKAEQYSLSALSEESEQPNTNTEVQNPPPLFQLPSTVTKDSAVVQKSQPRSGSASSSSQEENFGQVGILPPQRPAQHATPAMLTSQQVHIIPSSSSSSDSIKDLRDRASSRRRHLTDPKSSPKANPTEEHAASLRRPLKTPPGFERLLQQFLQFRVEVEVEPPKPRFLQRLCSCFASQPQPATVVSEAHRLQVLATVLYDSAQQFHRDMRGFVMEWLNPCQDNSADCAVEGFTNLAGETPVTLSSVLGLKHGCFTLLLLVFLIGWYPRLARSLYHSCQTQPLFAILLELTQAFVELLTEPVPEEFIRPKEPLFPFWFDVYAGTVAVWLRLPLEEPVNSTTKDLRQLREIGKQHFYPKQSTMVTT